MCESECVCMYNVHVWVSVRVCVSVSVCECVRGRRDEVGFVLTFSSSLQISYLPLAAASCRGVNFHRSTTFTVDMC